MKSLYALLAACALTLAPLVAGQSKCRCTLDDQRELKQWWNSIWNRDQESRMIIGQALFDDLLTNYPEIKPVFARVKVEEPNSPEFRSHVNRVMGGVDVAINLMGRPESLATELSRLNKQHLERDLKADYFQYFKESFLRVMPRATSCFIPQLFSRCFDNIIDAITKGMD